MKKFKISLLITGDHPSITDAMREKQTLEVNKQQIFDIFDQVVEFNTNNDLSAMVDWIDDPALNYLNQHDMQDDVMDFIDKINHVWFERFLRTAFFDTGNGHQYGVHMELIGVVCQKKQFNIKEK